jgi:hypothetical protein
VLDGAAEKSVGTSQENSVATSIKKGASRICEEEVDRKNKGRKKEKMVKKFGGHGGHGDHDEHEY